MSLLNSRPVLRWLAPAAAAVAVLGGGAAIGAITAAAEKSLPPRSAAELLVDLQTARLDGGSGTIVYRADLGLPDLSGLAGGGRAGSELTSLLSGTRTLRAWYAGPDQARVALLGTLGETDVIVNGRDLWIWDSQENQATHATLPEHSGGGPLPSPTALGMTPQQLADAALAMLTPSTEVSTDGSATVAGRDAYELVLSPRDPASLVASVRLAIDAEEHVPLRVQVFGRGYDSPALEAAFTQVSFERPDPSRFTFNPPPGAQITEKPSAATGAGDQPPAKPPAGAAPARPAMATVGSGWTTVLVLRPPAPADNAGQDGPGAGLGSLLEQLPRLEGPAGGSTVLTSRLFSVMLTDDGRILLGAVSAQRLGEAAADPAAALPS